MIRDINNKVNFVISNISAKISFFTIAINLSFSLVILLCGYNLASLMYLLITFMFYLSSSFALDKNINKTIFMLHLTYYFNAIFFTYYFGWDYGAHLFMLPSIIFSYLGNFKTRIIQYLIAFLGVITYYLIYYYFYHLNLSLNHELIYFNFDFKYIFNVYNVFLVAFLVLILVYNLHMKLNNDISIQYMHNEQLKVEASYDELTQTLNRWAFFDYLENNLISSPFNIAIIDIDYFKNINDTYGHLVGDQVLVSFSNVLKKHFKRKTELICRYGGEEFLILSSNNDYDDFIKHCNMLLEELKTIKIIDKYDIKFSVSIGALGVEQAFNMQDFDHYIRLADKNLYEAKTSGRKCMVSSLLK